MITVGEAPQVLSLSADGRETWSYELPRGVQKLPVDTIVSLRSADQPSASDDGALATSDGGPAWLFPGADGSSMSGNSA